MSVYWIAIYFLLFVLSLDTVFSLQKMLSLLNHRRGLSLYSITACRLFSVKPRDTVFISPQVGVYTVLVLYMLNVVLFLYTHWVLFCSSTFTGCCPSSSHYLDVVLVFSTLTGCCPIPLHSLIAFSPQWLDAVFSQMLSWNPGKRTKLKALQGVSLANRWLIVVDRWLINEKKDKWAWRLLINGWDIADWWFKRWMINDRLAADRQLGGGWLVMRGGW